MKMTTPLRRIGRCAISHDRTVHRIVVEVTARESVARWLRMLGFVPHPNLRGLRGLLT